MPLIVVGISVLILLVLMTKLKLNGFAALLLGAVSVGIVQGIPAPHSGSRASSSTPSAPGGSRWRWWPRPCSSA